jgi:endonuclease/exonuclease/phosphatase family metal-dependent hydrolase
MPSYNALRPPEDFIKKDYEVIFPGMPSFEKKRTIENLISLRNGLRCQISQKKASKNLLIASWNLKEFGHSTQRLAESYFYIAEIISAFDLVALQEVKSTLHDLNLVLKLLGDNWGFFMNAITEGAAGNSERSVYIFNRNRVEMTGLAGDIVLWEELTQNSSIKQLKRSPFLTAFQAGIEFSLINLHLHPGNTSSDVLRRREEVTLLLQALQEMLSRHRMNENLVLMGDFNLHSGAKKDDPTIDILNQEGYREVNSLVGQATNISQTQSYDHIFLASNKYFTPAKNDHGKEIGGVFNPYKYLFRVGQASEYKSYMFRDYTGIKDMSDPDFLPKYYKNHWRIRQISDHCLIWCEIVTDYWDEWLVEKLEMYK